MYDSMYVALAVRLNTCAIAADDRFEAALKKIPAVAGHIQLVQAFQRDVTARHREPRARRPVRRRLCSNQSVRNEAFGTGTTLLCESPACLLGN